MSRQPLIFVADRESNQYLTIFDGETLHLLENVSSKVARAALDAIKGGQPIATALGDKALTIPAADITRVRTAEHNDFVQVRYTKAGAEKNFVVAMPGHEDQLALVGPSARRCPTPRKSAPRSPSSRPSSAQASPASSRSAPRPCSSCWPAKSPPARRSTPPAARPAQDPHRQRARQDRRRRRHRHRRAGPRRMRLLGLPPRPVTTHPHDLRKAGVGPRGRPSQRAVARVAFRRQDSSEVQGGCPQTDQRSSGSSRKRAGPRRLGAR